MAGGRPCKASDGHEHGGRAPRAASRGIGHSCAGPEGAHSTAAALATCMSTLHVPVRSESDAGAWLPACREPEVRTSWGTVGGGQGAGEACRSERVG